MNSTLTSPPPILGFAAWSGTGKTTLLKQLIPSLKANGLRLAVIKHAHHNFDIDTPGKDSYELRKAGADTMLIGSRNRWALMVERDSGAEPRLDEMCAIVSGRDANLILVEGFKHERFPKLELHRPSMGRPLLFPEDDSIIAIASDARLSTTPEIPLLDLNNLQSIVDFVMDYANHPTPR